MTMTKAKAWGDTIRIQTGSQMPHKIKRAIQWWNAKRKRDLEQDAFRTLSMPTKINYVPKP